MTTATIAQHRTSHRFLVGSVLGATALATALTVVAPGAGTASAHGYSTPSGDAVGRPGFGSESAPGNPAPGVRIVQALGDRVFNQSTPFNKALDDSALGVGYHTAFGTPNYDHPTHGSNGTFVSLLNGGLIKTAYDSLQAQGVRLPDEADLDATLIRALSGVSASTTPHRTTAVTPAAAAGKSKACTVKAAKTTLRAQGSC
ncbi:hypothetical protein MANY_05810 [Mycolicibacterium anyangense]|uniref:Uncharacterized protein n=1 Tax=Mycolicibacterium anyangense TaxID=1431246 RepID=A0A6N4W584_9MYCO|nr:hypothetical protein [Mycolicibacterium anyangense]BBZ75244.1 hypothetical protein MANY_05810 [Mycolicibacterium anyangense]